MTIAQAAIAQYSCASGILSGSSCMTTSLANVSSYSCLAGFSLVGSNCSESILQSATISGYSCPTGSSLIGAGATSTCQTITTVAAAENYSCANGTAPLNGICTNKTATTAWTDTCGIYEASAGQNIVVPTP